MNSSVVRMRNVFPGGWPLLIAAALLVVLAWQVLNVVGAGFSRNLMFDGAMNLETARSIAEGWGPRRMYDSNEMFPPGVQTKEPYVLLGALVFKVFGVGPLQAQLPNLIYFLLLVGTIMLVVRRTCGNFAALAAAVLALATPWMTQYALNGYGEIPMFFFGLVSLAIVAWPTQLEPGLMRRCLIAGVFAGLAIATKVIGIALLIAVACLLLVRLLCEAHNRLRAILGAAMAMLAGVAIPLLLVECWHWFWLGNDGYVAWWKFQMDSIMSQSGAASASAGLGSTVSAKIAQHFLILGRELLLKQWQLIALLLVPLTALAFAFFRGFSADQRKHSRWLVLGLALIVALFFPWWLAMVPTEKAWLRYLYVGVLALAVLGAIGLVGNLRAALGHGSTGLRALHAVLALAVIGVYAPFLWQSVRQQPTFGRSVDMQASLYAADLISELDPNAVVMGLGWYAAPTIQLYSDRGFQDFTDWPIGRLVDRRNYLVADRASLVTGILGPTLARYPNKPLMRPNEFAQVYEVDFSAPTDPFRHVIPGTTLSSVEFANIDYAPTYGMEPFDPMGGRWVTSDSEILLRYDNQPVLKMSAYMALTHFYRGPAPLAGRVIVGGCAPIPFAFEASGWAEFRLPLQCQPAPGDVRVRILTDNVFQLPRLYDRQRAMLLGAIGFTD